MTTVTLSEVLAAAAPYKKSRRRNPGHKKAIQVREGTPGAVCMYTYHDGNHCVAGQILADLNLPVPEYVPYSLRDVNPPNSSSLKLLAERWLNDRDVVLDVDARRFLNWAQRKADGGDTWAEALSSAAREVRP